uniref:hydroxyethylthiazole kinase n=1 Tax=Pararhizobium sp. IMCC3301 TaxID=3067904 RepID=UPI0027406D92|nr:hydroxyethylthiazole kinase [Pararhizobium sp. IMCC3301]
MLDKGLSPDCLKTQAAILLDRVRSRQPRVHCITNSVAQTLTANVLLALGAEPSMTIAPQETGGFVSAADAVLINLGTLDAERSKAARIAAETALGLGRPFVLDPVFAHRSASRKALANTLLSLGPTAMRGNAEEVSGLNADDDVTIVAQTGETDTIRFRNRIIALHNGDPLMAKTTGAGCALGAVMAAFLATSEEPYLAVVAALVSFAVAGQLAAAEAQGPGSFVPAFLDQLYRLTPADIEKFGHLS